MVKNQLFYYCKNCHSKEARVIDNSGRIYTEKLNGSVKHVTVAALIKRNNKYLFTHRKDYPYGLCVPVGHLHYGESVDSALQRKLSELTGYLIKRKKLIFHHDMVDACKDGGEVHEWYLFECSVVKNIKNFSPPEKIVWLKASQFADQDIVSGTKNALTKIGLYRDGEDRLYASDSSIKPEPDHQDAPKDISQSIIETLPIAVILYDLKTNRLSFNQSAEKLYETHKNISNKKHKNFLSEITKIAKHSIEFSSSFSRNIFLESVTYNVIANPLKVQNKIYGASIIIKDVTEQKKKESFENLIYQSSLALSSSSSFANIVQSILKETLNSLHLTGCSLMLLEKDKLKTFIRLSKHERKKRKPLELKIGEGVAGWVAQKRTMIAVPDTGADPLYFGNPKEKEKSLLAVPVISANQLYGVLNASKIKGYYFSEDEIKTISTIANKIALAIENEKLYKKISDEKKTLETVLSTTSDGLILLDKELKLLFANSAAKRIEKLADEEIKNHHINNFIAKTSKKNIRKFLKYVHRSINLRKRYIVNFVSYRGPEKTVLTTFNPVIEKNGRCDAVLIGFKDITKVKKKEKLIKKYISEIEQGERKITNIIENSGDGIVVLDKSGLCLMRNKAMKEMTGIETHEEYVEKNPDFNNQINLLKKISHEKNLKHIYREIENRSMYDEAHWLGATYSFIKNDSGELDYIVISCRDISKEKKFEDKQKEFIYTTTHELRTPITAIKGYLSMILNGDAGAINPKQRLYFSRAYSSTDRLVSLVEDLLQTARIDEDRIQVEKKSFSGNKLINDVAIDFKQKAKEKNIKIIIENSIKSTVNFDGDYNRSKQALSNIVDNAIKYTKKGKIKISINNSADYGEIKVADSGIGIPQKEQALLFNKFYRMLNTESVKAGGTGLGLYIVKNLIEKQGGTVSVKSILKKGSTFTIALPLFKEKK